MFGFGCEIPSFFLGARAPAEEAEPMVLNVQFQIYALEDESLMYVYYQGKNQRCQQVSQILVNFVFVQ